MMKKIVGLGDVSDSSFVDSSIVHSNSAQISCEFQSPCRDEAGTDYGFDFTNSNIGDPVQYSNGQGAQTTGLGGVDFDSEQRKKTTEQNVPYTQSKRKHVQQSLPVRKPRKQINPEQRDKIFWKSVKKLQSRKDNIMPRLPFSRLVREILIDCSTDVTKITRTALEALQESSELYLTQQLQDAYTLTLHRGRVTLSVSDMELLRFIRGRN